MQMPRRSRADVLGVFVGVALSAVIAGRAALAAPLPASLQVTFPTLLAKTTAAPRLAASDKQKVPKPPPPPPTRTKGDKPSGDQAEHKDEDGSSDCVNNCFVGFGTSLFEGPTPPPAQVPATAFASEAARWAVGSQAWIVAPAEMDSVAIWDAPAEPERPPVETGTLPHGTHVVVVETHAMAGGFWTRVRPFDGVEPNGWVPSWILADAPQPKPAAPRPPKPDPRWGVRVLLAGGGLGPADLDVEYRDGGVRADFQYMRLDRQWISGFGFTYRDFFGHPPLAYLSGTTLDDPQDSKFQSYEIGTRAGQRYGDRSGFRFDWMLGPTLAYIHEHGNLHVYTVVPPGTRVPAGSRDDDLGRWAGGGELRLNFGWSIGEAGECGLHLGAFMFAWEGHEEHSLATDYVHSNIHGWDVGLSYSFFK
jgi:hypothetical protein